MLAMRKGRVWVAQEGTYVLCRRAPCSTMVYPDPLWYASYRPHTPRERLTNAVQATLCLEPICAPV
jgi:hypothetical protein